MGLVGLAEGMAAVCVSLTPPTADSLPPPPFIPVGNSPPQRVMGVRDLTWQQIREKVQIHDLML